MSRSLWVTVVLAVVALAIPAAPAGALTRHQVFGIANISPADLDQPALQKLQPKATREIADWAVALHPHGAGAAKVTAWYNAALAHNLQPLLSFGGFKQHHAPTVKKYGKAMKAAMKLWPNIHQWQAWNEGNNRTQPITNHNPRRAAAYAKALDRAVKSSPQHKHDTTLPCTIVLSTTKYTHNWVTSFVRAYGKTPKIWAVHGYSDANRFTYRGMQAFTRWFPKGKIWITETGALAYSRTGFKYNLNRQKKAVKYVFGAASKFKSRVTRLYWWQWQGFPKHHPKGVFWDSGLTAKGKLRPAYKAVLHAVRAH
jgi:hypothetical protein